MIALSILHDKLHACRMLHLRSTRPWAHLFAFTLGLAPVVGHAHAIVVAAQPRANAVVAAGELDLRLEFNSRIDWARSRLTLRSPQDTETPVGLVDAGAPNVLAGRAPAIAAGPWKLHWQVLSTDGHVTRGDIRFTVRTR
jgi:methionine-rich copper-binding protein CopC